MEKPIFIVGMPRSGSTLWYKILEKNEDIIGFDEMHFLNPWHKDFRYFVKTNTRDLSKDPNVMRMVNLLFSEDYTIGLRGWFWRKMKEVKDEKFIKAVYHHILDSDRSLGRIFQILIENLTVYMGYSRCYVKFPLYCNHIDKLIEWYPNSKIIHITRDPRGIAMSKTNDPGGTDRIIRKFPKGYALIRKIIILFVIIQYAWSSKIHKKYAMYENYALFKYEDLLLKPKEMIHALCEFCEIRCDEKMFVPEAGQPSSLTGIKREGIDRASAFRWRQYISPIESKFIEILTSGSMRRFSYYPEAYESYGKKCNVGLKSMHRTGRPFSEHLL